MDAKTTNEQRCTTYQWNWMQMANDSSSNERPWKVIWGETKLNNSKENEHFNELSIFFLFLSFAQFDWEFVIIVTFRSWPLFFSVSIPNLLFFFMILQLLPQHLRTCNAAQELQSINSNDCTNRKHIILQSRSGEMYLLFYWKQFNLKLPFFRAQQTEWTGFLYGCEWCTWSRVNSFAIICYIHCSIYGHKWYIFLRVIDVALK